MVPPPPILILTYGMQRAAPPVVFPRCALRRWTLQTIATWVWLSVCLSFTCGYAARFHLHLSYVIVLLLLYCFFTPFFSPVDPLAHSMICPVPVNMRPGQYSSSRVMDISLLIYSASSVLSMRLFSGTEDLCKINALCLTYLRQLNQGIRSGKLRS